jgi:integrase
MTVSRRKIGQLVVRQHIRGGVPTGKWYVDIPAKLTSNRRRHRRFFDNQRQAIEIAREVSRRLSIAGIPAARTAFPNVQFSDAAVRWCDSQTLRVRTGKKRAGSLRADRHRLKPLLAYFGTSPIVAIDERNLLSYQEHRLRSGRRPATINSEIGTLKHILKEAVKSGALSSIPTVEQIPHGPRPVTIPTPAEIVRVAEALPVRLRALIVFLAETGCRKGEALHLTWDNIDQETGFATIAPTDGWTPKTASSRRRIPLSGELLRRIGALPKLGTLVFPGSDPNKPMTDFRKALATAVRKAAITRNGKPLRITPHILRKANATWLANRGVHPRLLQSLLGHSPGSRMTDQHYVQATEEALRQVAIELPFAGHPHSKAEVAISGNT